MSIIPEFKGWTEIDIKKSLQKVALLSYAGGSKQLYLTLWF